VDRARFEPCICKRKRITNRSPCSLHHRPLTVNIVGQKQVCYTAKIVQTRLWKRYLRQYGGMVAIGAILVLTVYLMYAIVLERTAAPLVTR